MVSWFKKKRNTDKIIHPAMSHGTQRMLEDMAKEDDLIHKTIIGSHKPELKGFLNSVKDMMQDDFNNRVVVKTDWAMIQLFERSIAEFFGAPYAVAVDSCTAGIELVLRYKNFSYLKCPKRTYLSIPMLANKLNIPLVWDDNKWSERYFLSCGVQEIGRAT